MFRVPERLPIARRLQDVFEREAEKRRYRNLDEWERLENEAMLDEINYQRAMMGKSPIDTALYLSRERCARGHIDYSLKLALYSQELVMG